MSSISKKTLLAIIAALSIIPLLIIFMFTDTFSGGSIHTSYIPLTIEDLAKSDLIIIGRVEGIYSSIFHEGYKTRYPITYFNVNIDKIVAGNYSSNKVKVAVMGNEKYTSSEYDELLNETSKGKVLLFLNHAGNSSDIYGDAYLYRGYQGKFSIDENNIAHNPKYGDIPLDKLIAMIEEARNS